VRSHSQQLVVDTEQIAQLSNMGSLSVIDGHITAPDTPGIEPHPDWDELERKAVLVV